MTVSLLRDEHDLQLTVSDDGLGFDPEAVSGDGQYGLIGMRERAKLCNGQLSIDSGPGQGTTVRLTVKE
jgi:signal transduction histidine kinase